MFKHTFVISMMLNYLHVILTLILHRIASKRIIFYSEMKSLLYKILFHLNFDVVLEYDTLSYYVSYCIPSPCICVPFPYIFVYYVNYVQ